MQSECIRQVQAAMSEITDHWITDNITVARLCVEWTLPQLAWTADAKLLDQTADSGRARRSLVSNQNYPNIGGMVELLDAAHSNLEKLMCTATSDVEIVPKAALSEIGAASARGRECVVVTFALYLLFEKLPGLSDYALKAAEVDSFVNSLKQKAGVPPAIKAALDAACKPPPQ